MCLDFCLFPYAFLPNPGVASPFYRDPTGLFAQRAFPVERYYRFNGFYNPPYRASVYVDSRRGFPGGFHCSATPVGRNLHVRPSFWNRPMVPDRMCYGRISRNPTYRR